MTNDISEDTKTTETKTSPVNDFYNTYAKRLAASSKDIIDKLLKIRVDREIDDFVVMLDTALKLQTEQERALKKLSKPDQTMYNDKGEITYQGLSEKAHEGLKSAKQKYDRLSAAIDVALAGNGFEKLKEVTKESK